MLGSGLDHRRRRHRLDPRAGAADRALLPPRVVRQVHALPRGHQLDGEDARAGDLAARRPRWTSTSSPRSRRTSSATASACSATRWRCRSGAWSHKFRDEFEAAIEAGVTRRRARSTSRRPTRSPCRWGRRVSAERQQITLVVDGVEVAAPEGDDARRRRQAAATSRSRSSVTSRSSASRSAPAACAWSRSRGSRSCRPPARPRFATAWSSTRRPTASRRRRTRWSSSCSSTTRSTARSATRAASARCRTSRWAGARARAASIDPKRHFQKPIPLSPLIKIDRERCILCYRCVRFSQEVAEDEQLQLLERGRLDASSAPSTTAPTSPPSTATSSSSARWAR